MRPREEGRRMLQAAGYRLVRTTKHQIWRNDRGQTLVLPSSPADVRTLKNLRAEIRRNDRRAPR